jgi:hypothetical protein
MSRIIRPSNKVTVFDPETGNLHEAPTTDIEEMQRRAKKAIATVSVEVVKKPKKKPKPKKK